MMSVERSPSPSAFAPTFAKATAGKMATADKLRNGFPSRNQD